MFLRQKTQCYAYDSRPICNFGTLLFKQIRHQSLSETK